MGIGAFYTRYRRPILIVWIGVCTGLAVLYFMVYPQRADDGAVEQAILTHGHWLTWMLLGTAGAAELRRPRSSLANVLAYAGLGCYLAFIAAFALGVP